MVNFCCESEKFCFDFLNAKFVKKAREGEKIRYVRILIPGESFEKQYESSKYKIYQKYIKKIVKQSSIYMKRKPPSRDLIISSCIPDNS